MRKKYITITLLICAIALPAAAFAQISDDVSTWITYTNEAYGYEIKYPPEMELILGGTELEINDREFVIRVKESDDDSGISAQLYPGKDLSAIDPGGLTLPSLIDLRVGAVEYKKKIDKVGVYAYKWNLVMINGQEAIKGEVYFESTAERMGMFFIIDEAFFSIEPWTDFSETLAEEIISTFRFNR
ncbi:MAG: hypothetical protein WC532_00245 [Candidatus Omnitrophota bacterium]